MDRPSSDLLSAAVDGLLLEPWDDGCSVFCNSTGDTHHLSTLPAEILKRILAEPISFDELARSFATECEVENSRDWRAKISSIVDELQRLELVETDV